MKRLAVFLDGTYNVPDDNTNVWRLHSLIADQDAQQNPQLAYYDKGVGTNWYDRLRGGAVGAGLSQNVREAYRWLMKNYEDGDAIYIFGFSRGAFTARSLAGMISKCGLLKTDSPITASQLYERYEQQDSTPIYKLQWQADDGEEMSEEDKAVLQSSRRIGIKLLGLWDTVGALAPDRLPSRYGARGEASRHFVRLSKTFEHAYQALAVDEHRKAYPPSRWYRYIPEDEPDKVHQPPPNVEQRWFAGAHSNVGGGYRNDSLPQIPARWIQEKAEQADLRFNKSIELTGDEHLGNVVDSYAEFLKGFYRIVKFGKRTRRKIGIRQEKVSGGWIVPHHETIDASVFDKWRDDDSYRPKNLDSWAKDSGLDIATLTGTQATRS